MSELFNMTQRRKKKTLQPSPQVLQRAAKAVLSGKCQLSKPTYLKLKRHRHILKKLAALRGSQKSKKAFITRNKRQVGGFICLLPTILRLVGTVLVNKRINEMF